VASSHKSMMNFFFQRNHGGGEFFCADSRYATTAHSTFVLLCQYANRKYILGFLSFSFATDRLNGVHVFYPNAKHFLCFFGTRECPSGVANRWWRHRTLFMSGHSFFFCSTQSQDRFFSSDMSCSSQVKHKGLNVSRSWTRGVRLYSLVALTWPIGEWKLKTPAKEERLIDSK
jgi:hypothetical protein